MVAMEFPLSQRNVEIGEFDSDSFSSWDKCMEKSYCKWPAIVGIIVASVLVIGIVVCMIGCLCCGWTCCRGCCKCCTCCCPSDSHDKKRSKFADEPTAYQNPNYGYQPSEPPSYRPSPSYAQFDVPTSRTPRPKSDALPHMPLWESASTRRVEDTSDMEMNHLNPANGQTMGTVPRSNRGYYEVPTQPASPAFDGYRGTEATNPINRTPSPFTGAGAGPAPIGVARTSPSPSPYIDHGPAPPPFTRTFSPAPAPISSPPPQNNMYSAYRPPQAAYSPTSPTIPSSPPPPFSSVQGDYLHQPQQTPSLLQAGRRPVGNSWRDV